MNPSNEGFQSSHMGVSGPISEQMTKSAPTQLHQGNATHQYAAQAPHNSLSNYSNDQNPAQGPVQKLQSYSGSQAMGSGAATAMSAGQSYNHGQRYGQVSMPQNPPYATPNMVQPQPPAHGMASRASTGTNIIKDESTSLSTMNRRGQSTGVPSLSFEDASRNDITHEDAFHIWTELFSNSTDLVNLVKMLEAYGLGQSIEELLMQVV